MKRISILSLLLLFTISCNSEPTPQPVTDSDTILSDEDIKQTEEENDLITQDEDKIVDMTPDKDTVDPCKGFVAVDCDESVSICTAYNTFQRCEATECGTHFLTSECPKQQGCVKGECVANACSDECIAGRKQDGKICSYWNPVTETWTTTNQTDKLHDRFEEYQKWLHKDMMPFGGISDVLYKTEAHKQISQYTRSIDSALWTGTYLAAESMRYLVNGSPSARQNIIDTVNTLHLFLNVAGSPGLLSRYAFESSHRNQPEGKPLAEDMDCSSLRVFCDISYEGKNYDYKGNVSRDQYQGVLLGYSWAYDALGPEFENIRSIIRKDIVTFADTITSVQHLEVTLTYDNIPVDVPGGIDARFMVLAPREMLDGKATLNYCSKESDTCKNRIRGFQEFIPDMNIFLRQAVSWLPKQPIPRSSSAIMLTNILKVAMQVTEGIPEYQTQHDAFINFFYNNNDDWGNVSDWMKIVDGWKFDNKCGDGYYGINISMEPLFNLLRLEKDMNIRTRFQTVLNQNIWENTVKTHKNTFFAYIYASQGAGNEQVIKDATNQFEGFVNAPHVNLPIDLRDNPKYMPHSAECTDQVDHSICVDVADRRPADFIWQMKPFELFAEDNPKEIYPGVDYIMVYWMGRYYGYIQDDSDGKCFRWK